MFGLFNFISSNFRRFFLMFPTSSLQVPNKFPTSSLQVPYKFPTSSLQVPYKFPTSSLQVPYKFPTSSQTSSQQVPNISLVLAGLINVLQPAISAVMSTISECNYGLRLLNK
jgi:hypothetical protein